MVIFIILIKRMPKKEKVNDKVGDTKNVNGTVQGIHP